MTGLLVRKQLREIFKAYFYDAKHNRKRSKAAVAAYFFLFAVIMVGMLGGIFTGLSMSLCGPLTSVGFGWLYYILMGAIGILLGAFGSGFNTYASLYLAKDNDLLFSLPIPVNAIMVSRLLTVYLLGLMYSACVLVPASIVYWVTAGFTLKSFLGALFLLLNVSLIDLVLSCLVGYVVARISLKLKNKGIVSALAAVLFIVGYYVIYFHLNTMIQALVQNAEQYGAKIQGSAWFLYLFGAMGEGKGTAVLIWTAICAAAAALTWFILQRSFLKIATSTGAVKKTVYREKKARQRSLAGALLVRELKRFTGSANYMLNCVLGILFLPLAGIALLWQGDRALEALAQMFGTGGAVALLCAALCMAGTMIDTAAPSVSLEGKNLWLVQSLPVDLWKVLRAKLHAQLLLGGVPMLLAALCGAAVLLRQPDRSPVTVLLFVLVVLVFQVFLACWGLFWGTRMAKINWTSEVYPIKQSMPVFLALFGGWLLAAAIGGVYLWQRDRISLNVYLLAVSLLLAAGSAAMVLWLKGKGARQFAALQ